MTSAGSPITAWAESSRHLLSQAGALVLQANDQIRDGTFDYAQWAKSAYQLANLALTAGLEMGPLMPVPCVPHSPVQPEFSDFIEVDADNGCKRTLSVAKPFVSDGAPSCVIPNRFIVFVPDTLRVYATRFRIGVSWPDLPCGTYRGQVRLTNVQTGAVGVKDVIIDV